MPIGATAGADAIWFVEIIAGQVGRMALDGTVAEFPLPYRDAKPHAIIAGRDGTFWFTEWAGNRVGHITEAGAIQLYDLPTPASEPHGLTLGPDGAVWIALEKDRVARLESPHV